MTPFGIRKRIKSLFGLEKAPAAPAKATLPRHSVEFVLKSGDTYTAEAKHEDSLVLTSGRGTVPIATGCADGTCGTCQVEVLAGADQLSPATDHEADTKRKNGVAPHLRLGCQTQVLGPGVKVKVLKAYNELMA